MPSSVHLGGFQWTSLSIQLRDAFVGYCVFAGYMTLTGEPYKDTAVISTTNLLHMNIVCSIIFHPLTGIIGACVSLVRSHHGLLCVS